MGYELECKSPVGLDRKVFINLLILKSILKNMRALIIHNELGIIMPNGYIKIAEIHMKPQKMLEPETLHILW